ncbi:MAG: choice-of-anchor L domain-containing protein, partial [Bacteroidota bacterium]|nr:choice-of-anchor L domain-containing protein [Bacteroidota bacterium]
MKSPVVLRLFLSVLVVLASSHSISAQFTFENPANVNASTMAQALAGQGVTISNATLNCANNAYAQFTSAPAGLGITDGVLLTSGSAIEVNQNNDIFFNPQASNDNGLFGDPDLDASLSGGLISTDACVLVFDITVFGDTLKFDYRFGSEEYENFVCDAYNDVFGFYVSGANPAGGNYNQQNIALIPGTTIPVSINTVNDGFSDAIFPPAGITCDLTNTAFYGGVIPGVVYSGNTVLLEATLPTVACSTYTMKLAIGDGSEALFLDRIYDSGVFLKAGSFSSNQVVIAASSVVSDLVDFAVEGCVGGQFIFERTGDIALPYSLPIDIQGTATNGIDYTTINDTIFFTPGQQFDTVTITPISDGIQEGFETVTLYSLSQCNGIPFDSASITLFDSLPVTVTPEDTIVCSGENVILQGTAGPFTYDWSPSGILNSTNTLTVVANPT